MTSARNDLDVLFIGAVMNYDGTVGSLANHIRQDGKWVAPFQYIYQKRPEIFRDEAHACVYGVPNLSISKLADYLKRTVEDVNFHIVWHFDYHKDEVLDILQNRPPKLVAISTTLAFYPQFLNDAVAWIQAHKRPETKVVLGGKWIYDRYKLHGYADELDAEMDATGADYIVLNGYGEEALHQLLLAQRDGDDLRAASLPNMATRRATCAEPSSDALAFTGKHYCINHVVNEQHTPGEPMIDFANIGREFLSDVVHVRTCSSCPFKCKFCTFPVLQGEHVLFELDDVMHQLHQLADMGVKSLFFIDDTFNVPPKRFNKLLDRMIEADLGMTWVSFYRAQFANAEMTQKMYDAGCRMVFCGFESGNDQILKLMDKHVKVTQYQNGLKYLSDAGIETLASYIVGYPGETRETAMDTLELIDDPRVSFSRGSLFYYEPSAPVGKIAAEWELTGYGSEWKHKTMDSDTAAEIHLEMLSKLKGINTPISDGGAWSLFNLFARGLSWDEVRQLYRDFNAIQKQQVAEAGQDALDGYRAHAQSAKRRQDRATEEKQSSFKAALEFARSRGRAGSVQAPPEI
ncbi:MAG: radical SAM protein [Planctomycetota bacterium]